MSVIGLSGTEWKMSWSSSADECVGTVDQLSAYLTKVLEEEHNLQMSGGLPSKENAMLSAHALAMECPVPQFKRRTFKELGTPTVQAASLSDDRVDLSAAELLTQAERRRRELEDAGEIDWVSDRQPYPTGQGPTPDGSLIGKSLEIRWRYYHVETGKPIYIWCQGEVTKVSAHHSLPCM